MKRQTFVHILFLLLFCTILNAQKTFPFNESGYESVMALAKSQNKPVFYMVYASWCPHCHKMREQVFPDDEVSALIQKHYIVAAQDVDQKGGRALAKKLNVNSYPAFAVLDPDQKLLYGFSGELKKEDFIKEINTSLDVEKQLPYLEKAFENEPSNGNRALALIFALRKANIPTNDVALKYLSTQKENELVSGLNWKIIANGVSDMGSKEFQFVLKHQKEFAAVSSEKRVQRKIENIVMEGLKPSAERGDTLQYRKQRAIAKAMNVRKADSLVYVYDKQVYEKAKDWKSYKDATISATDEFASKDYSALRNTAAVYLAEIDDKEALKKAIQWSEKSVKLQQSKEGMLQIAKLHEKLGDISKAREAAQNAKDFCIKVGFGTKEADEILNRLQSR